MSKTYKKIEIVATSKSSFSDAVRDAIERASKTVKNMGWFEVVESGSTEEPSSSTR